MASGRTIVDSWHNMGRPSNLSLSWTKEKRGQREPISTGSRVRERRRGKNESQASFQDLRSSAGRFSLGQEQKFISLTRGTHGYPKRGISPKIQKGRFREIEVIGFRRLPTCVLRA